MIIVNLNRDLSPREISTILHFVHRGGGLLIAGDHTDISGVMGYTNPLIEHFGIGLRFDSAMPYTHSGTWSRALTYSYHPMNIDLRKEVEPRISVGASLDVWAGARPVVWGLRGFSDDGDRSAPHRAFLGNYRFDEDSEQLGDLVLAAESAYGNGRVLVFGDTAFLQETSFTANWQFVSRVIQYLLGGSQGPFKAPIWLRSLAITVMLVFTILLSRLTVTRYLLPLATVLTTVILCHCSNVFSWLDAPAPPSRSALVYSPQLPLIEEYNRAQRDTSGLQKNLIRMGYYPLPIYSGLERFMDQAEVIVLLPGTGSLSKRETDILLEKVTHGSILFLSVGFAEQDAYRELLARLGLRIEDVPLGIAHELKNSLTEDLTEKKVSMVEAWPIAGHLAGWHTLLEAWGYPVMIGMDRGKGTILVAGDSWFLTDQNLESDRRVNSANMLFLTASMYRE